VCCVWGEFVSVRVCVMLELVCVCDLCWSLCKCVLCVCIVYVCCVYMYVCCVVCVYVYVYTRVLCMFSSVGRWCT